MSVGCAIVVREVLPNLRTSHCFKRRTLQLTLPAALIPHWPMLPERMWSTKTSHGMPTQRSAQDPVPAHPSQALRAITWLESPGRLYVNGCPAPFGPAEQADEVVSTVQGKECTCCGSGLDDSEMDQYERDCERPATVRHLQESRYRSRIR